MNKSFYILFLFISSSVYGQSDQEYWDNWNKNYPEVDIASILKHEKLYAESVEKNPAIPRYYSRLDNYRFNAVYLGKTRATSQEVINQ